MLSFKAIKKGWKEFHEPVSLERAVLEIAVLLIVIAIIISIVWGG